MINRRVTFNRKASIVKPFDTVIIYIADDNGDESVCDKRCRKLCALKNGQSRTVDISYNEVSIIFAFNNGKNLVNIGEYQLEEGTDSKVITGRFMISSSKEPTFCFSEEKESETKRTGLKGYQKFLIILAVALVLTAGVVLSPMVTNYFYSISKVPMTFESDKIRITLTESFVEVDPQNHHKVYYSLSGCWVFVENEVIEKNPALMEKSLDEYCKMLQKVNNDENSPILHENGLTYYVSEKTGDDGKIYSSHMYVYKTDETFWFVQFVGVKKDVKYWTDSFPKWAGSVEFK